MKTDNFRRRATDVYAPENDQNVQLKSSVLQQLIKTSFEGDISESKISNGNSVPDREIKSCLSEKDSNSSWRIIKVVKESDLIAENELRAEEQTQTASENILPNSDNVIILGQQTDLPDFSNQSDKIGVDCPLKAIDNQTFFFLPVF